MILRTLQKKEVNKILKDLEVNGFIKIDNFIKQKEVKKFLNLLKRIYSKGVNNNGLPARDSKDLRINNLAKRDKSFCDLISDPQLEKFLKPKLNDKFYRFLPNKVPNYILGGYNGRSSGDKLDLHIDSFIPFTGDYNNVILVLFVLEDMSGKNGATIIVPKSHKSGTFTDRSTKNIKVINAKAGDVLILDARTWHGTTDNKTDKSRWLITSAFYSWWMKQQVDFPKSMPKSILKKLTNKQKQLLGFCSIPPITESDRINTKCGYEVLKKY